MGGHTMDFAGSGDPGDPRNRNATRVVKGEGRLNVERRLGTSEREGRTPESIHFDPGFRAFREMGL